MLFRAEHYYQDKKLFKHSDEIIVVEVLENNRVTLYVSANQILHHPQIISSYQNEICLVLNTGYQIIALIRLTQPILYFQI